VATFKVTNLNKYQHYAHRNPPWIKLYRTILSDHKIFCLSDASKFHFIAIILLASRDDNILPFDPEYIGRQIGATSKVDLNVLIEAGLLLLDTDTDTDTEGASAMLASATRRQHASNLLAQNTAVEKWFDEFFWKEYPRPEGKAKAREKILALMPDDELRITIMGSLRHYKQTAQWMESKKFVPHAASWIHQKRYEDEIKPGENGGKPDPIAEGAARYEKQMAGEPGQDGSLVEETENDIPY